MTQHKARKAAIGARMERTGEPYSEAARRLDEQAATSPSPTVAALDALTQELGIPRDALTLAMRHSAETEVYPLLAAAAANRVRVYLDLKDWVALAKVRLGRPEFPHDQAVYEALRNATMSGLAIVPLSLTTYMEVERVSSLRQRADLANVIAEISGFVTITSRSSAVDHQMRAALASRFGGPAPQPLHPFGLGVSFASGDRRRLVLRGRDGTTPDLQPTQVREMETIGRAVSEYMQLCGPTPEDIPHLRKLGFRPELVAQVEQERVKRETELAAMLRAGALRRDRLNDVVHARHLFWELRDHLGPCLAQYGIDIEEFFAGGKQWLTEFLDDIPSAAVTVTLMEKSFRNSDKAWTGNDLRDADAVSAAIPYCTVVMTDKYVAAQLKTSQAVARQGTIVLSRLRDLNEVLPGLIAAGERGTA
jgi:hypothetical protein